MAETASEIWSDEDCDLCSSHSYDLWKQGFAHKGTAFERIFSGQLRTHENRRRKKRKLAPSFEHEEARPRLSSEGESDSIDDIDEAISRRTDEVHHLLTRYAKENGIVYVPFLSREEEQLHRMRTEVYSQGTRILEEKRRELFLRNDQRCGDPRWYKPLSKPNRIARLQKKFLHRYFKTQDQMRKEKFALEWHLNFLRFHFLPFFLDPSHTYENDNSPRRLRSAKPRMARKLLSMAIQNYPIRENLFQHLSAYDIAKVFHVMFPTRTKEAATHLIGENQVRYWMNPLRDIFTTKQLAYLTESLLINKFSRESLVFFGPDSEALQERLWDVPAYEARRKCTKHPLRIFFTWSHSDRKRAWRQSFGLNDLFSLADDIFFSRPGNDGEPHQGLGLREFLYADWGLCDDFESIYGRTLRLGCPDSDLYAEQIWADTMFYWTPLTLQSDIRPRWGNMTTTALQDDADETDSGNAITLHGGSSHGIPPEVLHLTSRKREDLSPVWDGSAMRDVLEIPFVTYSIRPTDLPRHPVEWEISKPSLLIWNPESTAVHPHRTLDSPRDRRRELRRQGWTQEIQRSRHFVYHQRGRKWWKQWMVYAGETVAFQGTFAWMAVRDHKFFWKMIKEGEITVLWVNFSRWLDR